MSCDDYSSSTVRQRERREVCRSFTCISPWFLTCRWFNGRKSCSSRNWLMERRWGKETGNLDLKRKNGILKASRNHEASSSSAEDVSEVAKEVSFNLGVGLGLVYLLAASRNELNYIVDLHKKIELLLQNTQTESQNEEKSKPLFMPSKFTISSSFSSTAVRETLCAEENDSVVYVSSNDVRRADIKFGSDRYRREKSLRMDQLEAEFGSLQLPMDAEFNSEHQYSEMKIEESVPEWSLNTCFEEDTEQQELRTSEYYGVPPRELERKLHELLETRQQERINELESSLVNAMQQLEEKERELCRWKDTARLIAQHLPPIPNLPRPVKQGSHSRHPKFEVGETSRSLVKNSPYDNRAKCSDVGAEF